MKAVCVVFLYSCCHYKTVGLINHLISPMYTISVTHNHMHKMTCAPTNYTHINTPHSRCGVKAPLIK